MASAETLSALVSLLESAGYPRAETALLQRADVFLDLSGEDIRRRLYLTQDAAGTELCLRPEYTIPLCLELVARPVSPPVSAMSYCGPVFRHRQGENGEFLQAGIESIGRTDSEAADAEIVAVAVRAAGLLGLEAPVIRLGDAGLISGLLDRLAVPSGFARRLKRRLAAGVAPADAIGLASGKAGLDRYSGVMAALAGANASDARQFVGDLLAISGVKAAGGRTTEEISERFLAKAQEGAGVLDEDRKRVLEDFLAIAGHPDAVAGELRRFSQRHGLDMAEMLDRYEARVGFIAANGVDLDGIRAAAGFVRNLDYYTGMVFEIALDHPSRPKPLVGGGRYDTLLRRLGAAADAPAVGFSIWVERFDDLGSAA